jgi:heat shock protein HtpX
MIPGQRIPVPSLLRTHPLKEERIRRLMALNPATQPHPEQTDLSYNVSPGHVLHQKPRWHTNGLWH